VFLREENPMSQKKEGKEKVPNPVLSLEEIERGKALSVERSSKRRPLFTAEKKFDLFLESCRSPGRIGEMLRREGLYHTDLARIRSVVEEGALAALRSVRPGKKKKPPVPAEAHEALLREKEEVEKALASLAMENQALKKAWRGGSRGR
jgi:transposase-like protein